MKDTDYSVESDEEFYEDFSGRNLSDEELNNALIKARKEGNVKLRIIVKELQYTRFLLKNITDFIVDPNNNDDLLTIQKLVKNYVTATAKANNK